MNNEITTASEVMIKMVLDAWESHNKRLDKLIGSLNQEQLAGETAPGRNSGKYLLGHLVAVNDAMLPLLGFGERLYPQLENIFLKNPDKSGIEMPSDAELKKMSEEINAKLSDHIKQVSVGAWFNKHTAVSDDDFAKEPHRNKLNIIINRTNHLSYHLGQLAYLKK